MSNLSPAQLAKLPKYARQEIERLEHSVTWWKQQATAGPEESDTFVERSHDEGGRQPLGRGERVTFEGPQGSILVHTTAHGVEIETTGGEPLVLLPRSTNRAQAAVIDHVAEIMRGRQR